MKRSFLTLLAALACFGLAGQESPAGLWKSIDDSTGEAKSHVEIFEQNGAYYGRIVKILTDNTDARCTDCSGEKADQPVLGLLIIEDLQPYKDYWRKGTILDPENGNEYRCSVWFEEGEPNRLRVRGKHWTGLYRTQVWERVGAAK